MTPQRKKKSPSSSKLEELGLSRMFAPSSTTRAAAELLLSGEPITRQELVRRTNVVETVVPRTVNRLRQAGIDIAAEQDPVSKVMTYRAKLPTVDRAPEGSFQFSAREGTEPMVKLEQANFDARRSSGNGGVYMSVELDSPLGRVSGTAPASPLLIQSADEGIPLSSVVLLPGGEQEWILGRLPNTVLVSDIKYI